MSPDDASLRDRSHDRVDHERLRDLVSGSMTTEFASVRSGKPATYPLTPFYDREREAVVVTSPPAFAGKVETVKEDPRVSLLLAADDGEYLVTGRGTVRDDDPEANAAYVRDLIASDPETQKRGAFEEATSFLDSRIGRWLMGWYALRVVVEIDPALVTRIADPAPVVSLPAWPQIGMDAAEADRHERAVVTVADEDGYPVTRPVSGLRIHEGRAAVDPGPPGSPDDGQPACLLVHWHADGLQRLGQRVVRGRFRTRDGDRLFDPRSCTTMRNDGILDTIRFILDGKRRTRAYCRDG